MVIYGVCISDIEKINEEKAIDFLKELSNNGYGYIDYLEDFLEKKDETDGEYSFNDWAYDYESYNGYFGLAAFLRDVIEEVEGIDIVCDDPNGIHYLGLSADAPWNFNFTTKRMSEKDYNQILTHYINKVTDDVLNIKWWVEMDDCDW